MPSLHLFASMQASLSKICNTLTQYMLGLTLYNTMRSSHDFEDVREMFNDRIVWSIELFRSCFTIRLSNGSHFFMMCSLFFLLLAENIHIHYGRLSPAELKKCVEHIGYVTFAILLAVLDIGFVIVRIAALVALSRSLALAASLVLVSTSPPVVLPMLTYLVRLLRQRKRESGEVRVESGAVVDANRS